MPIEKPKTQKEMIDMMWMLTVGPDEDGMYYQIKALSKQIGALADRLPKPRTPKQKGEVRGWLLDLIKILVGALGGGGVAGIISALTGSGV